MIELCAGNLVKYPVVMFDLRPLGEHKIFFIASCGERALSSILVGSPNESFSIHV